MNKIIDINEASKKLDKELTEEDLFNLFMIYRHMNKDYFDINIILLEKSLSKYMYQKKYEKIYKNISTKIDDSGNTIVDLSNIYNKYLAEKILLKHPKKDNTFSIIAPDEYLDAMKNSYSKETYRIMDSLFFNIYQDFKYGLDNWSMVFEDEYIEVPNYPPIVTGEFLDEKKDSKMLRKAKQRAKENYKNLMK